MITNIDWKHFQIILSQQDSRSGCINSNELWKTPHGSGRAGPVFHPWHHFGGLDCRRLCIGVISQGNSRSKIGGCESHGHFGNRVSGHEVLQQSVCWPIENADTSSSCASHRLGTIQRLASCIEAADTFQWWRLARSVGALRAGSVV